MSAITRPRAEGLDAFLSALAALDHGVIAGAGIDVYDSEPCTDSPLVGCKNAVLTPHVASFTSENFIAMNNRAAQNVLDILSGTLDGKYRLA